MKYIQIISCLVLCVLQLATPVYPMQQKRVVPQIASDYAVYAAPLASMCGGVVGYVAGDYLRDKLFQYRTWAMRGDWKQYDLYHSVNVANRKLARCGQLRNQALDALNRSQADTMFDTMKRCNDAISSLTQETFRYDCQAYLQKLSKAQRELNNPKSGQYNRAWLQQRRLELQLRVDKFDTYSRKLREVWAQFKEALSHGDYAYCQQLSQSLKSIALNLRDVYGICATQTPHDAINMSHARKVVAKYNRFIRDIDTLMQAKRRFVRGIDTLMQAKRREMLPLHAEVYQALDNMDVTPVSQKPASAWYSSQYTWLERLIRPGLALCGALAGYGIAALCGYAWT